MPTSRQLLPRSDGARYRSLRATIAPDGALTFTFNDVSGDERAVWGADETELTLTFAPTAVAELTLALLAAPSPPRITDLAALQQLADTHAIPYDLTRWS